MLQPYQQPPLPPPTPFSSSPPSPSSSSSYSPASCPPPPPSSSGPPSAGSYRIGSAMRELPGVVCRQWACPSNRWGGEGIMEERRGEESARTHSSHLLAFNMYYHLRARATLLGTGPRACERHATVVMMVCSGLVSIHSPTEADHITDRRQGSSIGAWPDETSQLPPYSTC